MGGLVLDLRFAVRSLARNRGFAAAAVLALGLGIGASSAIFSVVHAVALRPLPFPEPARIVALSEVRADLPGRGRGGFLLSSLDEWQRRSRTLSAIAAYWSEGFTVTRGAGPEAASRLLGARVTPDFFEVLGTRAEHGRTFDSAEVNAQGEDLVVLGQAAFRRYLGGDPRRVGGSIELDGRGFTVVGVMPEAFRYPDPSVEAWVPLVWRAPTDGDVHREIMLPAIGRLRDGVTIEQARAEGSTLLAAIQKERGEAAAGRPGRPAGTLQMETLLEQQVAPVRPAMRVLAGAVLLVLLIACANVASLLLTRGLLRHRELATRAAVGAGRGGLLRLLLLESALLSLLGCALGLLLAGATLRLIAILDPGEIPRLAEVGLHSPVVAFGVLLGVLSALSFGVLPALQARYDRLVPSLHRDPGRAAGPRFSRDRFFQSTVRGSLVVGEVALAFVLLVAAGLLGRSFLELTRVDPGYDPGDVLTFSVTAPLEDYPPGPSRTAFFDALLDSARSLEGVESAGLVSLLPLARLHMVLAFSIEGRPAPSDPRDAPQAGLRVVAPGYFETLGIPVLAGRRLAASDVESAPPVVVVNRALERRYFSEGSAGRGAVGQRLQPFGEVVGVVGDVRYQGLDSDPEPTLYVSLDQAPAMIAPHLRQMAVVVKGEDPLGRVPALRTRLAALDPRIPLEDPRTLEQRLSDSVALERFYAVILAVFALLALLLAVVGVYGLLSFMVTQRSRETGIRVALGARRSQILGHTLWRGLRLSGLGIALGVLGSALAGRLLQGMLFGIEPSDPSTWALLATLLLATAALASYLPARRAAGADPVEALRHE